MYDAARIVGDAVRTVHKREAKALAECGIDFNVSIIFGGQIKRRALPLVPDLFGRQLHRVAR